MPVFNESANIVSVLREWFVALEQLTADFVLLVINDGSTDDTGAILSQLSHEFGQRLSFVNKTNSGHGRSCREGYELALAQGARWIFQIDSDGQCDPKFLGEFFHSRAQFDCVFGYRQTRDDGIGRAIVSRCCRTLLWLATGSYVKDPNVPYRLIRAATLRNALRTIPCELNLQNIALSLVLKRDSNVRWKYLPIHFRARQSGESSISYRKLPKSTIELLRDLRRIDDTSRPAWRPSLAQARNGNPARAIRNHV
jgi:dolichol-phosphate mannosyltransferase